MPVIAPLNDVECLTQLHDLAIEYAAQPEVRELARHFRTVDDAVEYIRRLPQRDDLGDPADGPRLPCEITQRVRYAPSNPNCFERDMLFLSLAQNLDPHTEYTSASAVINGAWHTFPVEIRDGLPRIIVLDPYTPPRNALAATAYEARNVAVTDRDVIAPWFLEVARNACVEDGADGCLDGAIRGLRNGLLTGEPIGDDDVADLGYVLSVAAQDAELWGARGRTAAGRVRNSVRKLSEQLDRGSVGRFLGRLASTGKAIAPHALRVALIAQYGPAAAIALDGVSVGMEPSAPVQPAKGAPPAQPAKGAQPAQGRPDAEADQAESARDEPQTAIQTLRRMTFGFRTV